MENLEISRENSHGTAHPGGNFTEKSNSFRGITFFPFLPKRPKFSVPFVWITSARLQVGRKRKIYRYFVNGTTQSRSCFRCPKNTSTIWRKFLTEISVQMVSALNFARRENVKEKTYEVVKFSPVNEKHLLISISLFQDYALFINKRSSTLKLYPGFLNFHYQYEKSQKWTHWFNRDNTIS